MFNGHTKGMFIGRGLRIVGTPLKWRCHSFHVQVVDGISDFPLSGFPDKKRTDWLVVLLTGICKVVAGGGKMQ